MTSARIELLPLARKQLSLFVIRKAAALTKQLGFGYVDSDDAPESYPELMAYWMESTHTRKAFPVWSGASDNTIYTSVGANYAFRFWHDSLHARNALGFNYADEVVIGTTQTNEVAEEFGEFSLETLLMHYDTVGQSTYANMNGGQFPEDQLAWVTKEIETHIERQGYVNPWATQACDEVAA